jgi:hypothetical protein
MRSPSLKPACVVVGMIALIVAVPFTKADDSSTQAQVIDVKSIAQARGWALRLPEEEIVAFKGEVSFDNAGAGTGQIVYPGGVAGLVVGVITHAALVAASRHSQKTEFQEQADKVLIPYKIVLADYKYRELMQLGVSKTSINGERKLVGYSKEVMPEWLIMSTPIFSLTQDQSAIILDNVISIYAPNGENPILQYTVRVVSKPIDNPDPAKFWVDNKGDRLKEQCASLFAESIDDTMNVAAGGMNKESEPYKTFRYFDGKTERMERGQLVSRSCDRLIIKNLRGWLMSIPAEQIETNDSAGGACNKNVSNQ